MVSISEAYHQIIKNSVSLSSQFVDLNKATSYYLSEDVISPIHMPPFRQSAMDGYALNLHENEQYNLIGEIKAGDSRQIILNPGDAVRIFTGAPVPDSANAVVMQEKVVVDENRLKIESRISPQENIRPIGEQVQLGKIALPKGTLLTPAAIGFLSSLGIARVNITRKPSIAIVSTGNELIAPGELLERGKIYESNITMLYSALNSVNFHDIETFRVKDDYEATLELIDKLMNDYEMVIITGGISVGDYDFVGKALKELKVKELFYKVKQKPGKPLYYGKKGKTTVFGLPGNPAAALSCFYIYVRTCLELISGNKNHHLSEFKASSVNEFVKKGDRPQFLKAIFNGDTVEILEGQSSAMLQTFAIANALVFIPEEVQKINMGDVVEVIPLPV